MMIRRRKRKKKRVVRGGKEHIPTGSVATLPSFMKALAELWRLRFTR